MIHIKKYEDTNTDDKKFIGNHDIFTVINKIDDKDIEEYINKTKPDLSVVNEDGLNIVMYTLNKYWNITAKILINHGAKTDGICKYSGWNTLMYAYDEPDVIKLLLKKNNKLNINHQNNHGETALMIAAKNNKLDTIKLLIQMGANINIVDHRGKTFYEYIRDDNTLNWVNKKFPYLETSKRYNL